jgi:ubiquinone/menaquinone biosynthesis C-methylase UbiE
MGVYSQYVLPRLINLTMRNKRVAAERARLVPLASGKVLEVGIGSGLNIPFYTSKVETLVGLDPSAALWHMARKRADLAPFPIEYLELSGERIPVADGTFDTVVSTWTLCTIPHVMQALQEMQRVLKQEGRLIFIEHGLAPDRRVQGWQNWLNPLWKRLAGGCNLNRTIATLISGAGFHITQIDTGYLRGPKPFSFLYQGLAQPG